MVDPQTVRDVEFVGTELLRFIELSPKQMFEHLNAHRQDFLATVPSPGGGSLFVGREAHDRFYAIANRELPSLNAHQADFDIANLATALRQSFSDVFLSTERAITDVTVAEMLARAIQSAEAKHTPLTHHIPCIISLERSPTTFDVGPVRFESEPTFIERMAEPFERYRARAASRTRPLDEPEPIEDVTVRETKEFYDKFPWVATVSVPRCEPRVSELRAIAATDAALDALRLFFPDPFGVRLRRGHSDAIVTRSSAITSDAAGEIAITRYYMSDDAPSWLGQLLEEYGEFLGHVGIWLSAHVHTGAIPELQRRWLDALHWYGQAISDDTRAGRLLKLTAAFERLTVAKERTSGIASVVTNRVALLAEGQGGKDFRSAKKTVYEVYRCRSQLMHGTKSPYDRDVAEVSALGTAVARWVMFNALRFYRALEESGRSSAADLESAFKEWLVDRTRVAG